MRSDTPGAALAPGGRLNVADVRAERIVEIDPQTGNVAEITGNLPIELVGAPGVTAD